MLFSNFIKIVLEILGSYYFIIILYDALKSNKKVARVTTHTVQFETPENPVLVSDEAEENLRSINTATEENFKKYLPPEDFIKTNEVRKKSPIIDMGLETLSGDAYTVNAENLSKFMIG